MGTQEQAQRTYENNAEARRITPVLGSDGTIVDNNNPLPVHELMTINVPLNKISGYTQFRLDARCPTVSTSWIDLYDVCNVLDYPTANESWEIVSTSVNDILGGTGANVVQIQSLDDDYNVQTPVIVLMNGTTPVPVSGTHFRVRFLGVVSSGSLNYNEGFITLRRVSDSEPRAGIDNEQGIAKLGHYTVPAGVTAILYFQTMFGPKNSDIDVKFLFQLFGTNTWWTGTNVPLYQNILTVNFITGIAFPEKSELKVMAKAGSGTFSVENLNLFYEVTN